MNVSVVGTGYVGLVTGVCLASIGHRVACVDVDRERVNTVNDGVSPFLEPGLEPLLRQVLEDGAFKCVHPDDWEDIGDVTFLAVATPSGPEGQDQTFIRAAAKQLGERVVTGKYHVAVVKSTVVPGTTREVVWDTLKASSDVRREDLGICSNPEFLREGSAVDDFMDPDRIVIGSVDRRSGDVVAELYSRFDCPVVRTSLENAEAIKYASNALLSTLISFSNEMAAICETIPGADVREVMQGVHEDRRLSVLVDGEKQRPGILSYLWAGCGFGGSCLPKDVNALRHHAHRSGMETGVLDGVMQTNEARAQRFCDLAAAELGDMNGKVCALLGLTFKAGTDDLRDSPALRISQVLQAAGATVRGYDPAIPEGTEISGVEVFGSAESCTLEADCVMICTAWEDFRALDWDRLVTHLTTPVVVDGRDLLDPGTVPEGCTYLVLGRGYSSEEAY